MFFQPPVRQVALGSTRTLLRSGCRGRCRSAFAAVLQQQQQQQQKQKQGQPVRFFSDRLLGHSPMAQTTGSISISSSTTTTTSSSRHIPTAQDVTTAGGVWAPTSAKRDKLGELRAALAETFKADDNDGKKKNKKLSHPFTPTLDDLATPTQALDLYLADGLLAVASVVDADTATMENNDNNAQEEEQPFYTEAIKKWMMDIYAEKDDLMTQHQYEDYLRRFLREMERHLAAQLSSAQGPLLLQQIRDFVPLDNQTILEQLAEPLPSTLQQTPALFQATVQRYRLLLATAAAQVLLEKAYKPLTTISNHDIDRAAVQGQEAVDEKVASLIPIAKLEALLESYLWGNAATRVDAWWNLMDRDNDGLLEEAEMSTVCELAIQPVGKALQALLQQALDAHPVLVPLATNDNNDSTVPAPPPPPPQGWRQRRREAQHKRRLQKMFTKTIKDHFVMEVEMAHRLRCIYAWANKGHQDNAVKSVLVDEIAWTGRKRYVELPPKISLLEFRQVQQEHFTHLDRVATEYLKSFKEDLWILQGNGRQRAELYRDCAIFMAVVCGVDYIIITL